MKKYLGSLILPLMFVASSAFAATVTITPSPLTQSSIIFYNTAIIHINSSDINGIDFYEFNDGNNIGVYYYANGDSQFAGVGFSGTFQYVTVDESIDTGACGSYATYDDCIADPLVNLDPDYSTGSFTVIDDSYATACANGTTLNTTTMACSIDNLNSGVTGYVYTLLAHYWPFVVGAGVLVGVWHFGMAAITLF